MRCLSVRPSVRHVRTSVETNNGSSKSFHHWVATPFQYFHTKRHDNIQTRTPVTGALNAGVVGLKSNSNRMFESLRPILRYVFVCAYRARTTRTRQAGISEQEVHRQLTLLKQNNDRSRFVHRRPCRTMD